ncbi:MAG: putative lipid II flippase FtsW [Acidobacteria bacterium]|nr:putative lipid II flippase FtsW [Acidobacteriota bacterium]
MAYKPTSDKILFIVTALLTIFGLVMVHSASSMVASFRYGMSSYYLLRQLAFAALGFTLMITLMNVDYHTWQRKRPLKWILVVCAIMLVLVFLQPPINGSHRWIRYGPLSFQPSEFAKLALLMFLATYLNRHDSEINMLRMRLLPCMCLVGIYAALIAREEDLGQAACVIAITALMLFIAGLSWLYVAGTVALGAAAFYFFVVCVPWRWERILVFLRPFHDPLGAGWQVSQSLTAVGSGGILGLGLGASRQKLFFLPTAHSDSIYAVISEELGLVGAAAVLLLFAIFFHRGLKIASRAPDRFGFYLGLGITMLVVLQALVNISMVLALLPTKGIALPFISQGGSSLLLNLVATGILLNISQYGEKTLAHDD